MYPRTHRTSLADTPGRQKWKQESKMLVLAYPLTTLLLQDERLRLNNVQKDLIKQNHQMGESEYGFRHGDKLYSPYLPAQLHTFPITLKPIHSQLKQEAEDLHQLWFKLSEDMQQLHQSLTVVLGCCHTKQEVRDVLPDNLGALLPDLAHLPRIKEPGYLIQDNKILYQQYQKAIDVAYYYTANKLIF